MKVPSPTTKQIKTTDEIVGWYFASRWGTPDDLGTPSTFFRRDLVGHFAITPAEFEAGDSRALFRLLVAVSLFQRLRDQLVLGILRGMERSAVEELTSPSRLLELSRSTPCGYSSIAELVGACDLAKDERTKAGCCGHADAGACYLHRHTEALKRYGHFGKTPTTLALAVRAAGVDGLDGLYQAAVGGHRLRPARAAALVAALSAAWRINDKLASMFLSLVCTPGLSRYRPPWRDGVDWTHFVVIDSNVDEYLRAIGYSGAWTYGSRREFLIALARKLDLRRFQSRSHRYNPRVVQQAIYMFSGASNRRATAADCSRAVAPACARCPPRLQRLCPVRP